MSLKTVLGAFAIAGTMTVATTASAAKFDFGQIADDFYAANGYEAIWADFAGAAFAGQAYGGAIVGNGIAVDGVTINYMETGLDPTPTPGNPENDVTFGGQALFDSGNAGLGVCMTDGGFGCSTGGHPDATPGGDINLGDDNLQSPEYVFMTFDQAVSITEIVIHGVGHTPYTGDIILNFITVSVVGGIVDLSGIDLSDITSLSFDAIGRVGEVSSYYIHSLTAAVIPLPAGVVLLLSGLGGLGFVGWRRRRQMAAA